MDFEELVKHLNRALEECTQGVFYQNLLDAKEWYSRRTGRADDTWDDYELRMHSFNDWYLFHYVRDGDIGPILNEYIKKYCIDGKLKDALTQCHYSLFEYSGKNLRGNHTLKDILTGKKLVLTPEQDSHSLYKSDLFLGRVLPLGAHYYLTKGKCLLPKESKSLLKKQFKKVKKLNNREDELNFLLDIEALNSKWKSFGHVDVEKIFVFPETAQVK